jgi:hypothetical protein
MKEEVNEFKNLIRTEAEKATSEMLQCLRENNLDGEEASECYGYIRGVRDLIYALNLQKNGESNTHDDLLKALVCLQALKK